MQGKLIVFEGVEGSGKTTQIARSQAWLAQSPLLQDLQAQGHLSPLMVTREPGGTQIGRQIRQILLQPAATDIAETLDDRTELLLYAADRAHHVQTQLQPQLQAGALILCDRFTDSTLAYQGYGRKLDLTLIDRLNQIATDGLESDLTLWLDLDVEMGLARTQRRGAADRIELADLAFHQRVQQGFKALSIAHPLRIVRVDASLTELEVAQQIQTVLEHYLRQWYSTLLPRSSDSSRQSSY